MENINQFDLADQLETIVEIFMRRDGMNFQHAYLELADMRKRVRNGDDPEEVLEEYGLEPDYLFDLIDFYTVE